MELASCQPEPSSPLSEAEALCGLGSSLQVLVSPCDLGLVPSLSVWETSRGQGGWEGKGNLSEGCGLKVICVIHPE